MIGHNLELTASLQRPSNDTGFLQGWLINTLKRRLVNLFVMYCLMHLWAYANELSQVGKLPLDSNSNMIDS
jgi:hypothetical protein